MPDLAGILSKRLKKPLRSCQAFVRDAELVAQGLRQAHLIDAFDLLETELNALMTTLRSHAEPYNRTFLLHERTTGQTFLLNADLLPLDKPSTIFVDAETAEILDGPPAAVSAMLTTIREQAGSLVADAVPPHVIMDLGHLPHALDRDATRSAMVALCGVLLEFPFSYVVVADTGGSLGDISLMVLELLLQGPEHLPRILLKCSVPQAAVNALGQTAYAAILDQSLQTFQSRLSDSGSSGTLSWSCTTVMLDRVAL